MQRLAGRVVVVTGAADGIGRAVAVAMAVEGAAVVVADDDQAGLNRIQTELEKLRTKWLAICTDVTNEESVNGLVSRALAEFDKVDILVNGVSLKSASQVAATDEALWDKILRVNLVSAFLCAKAVAPGMIARRYGRIISFTSDLAFGGSGSAAPYIAAKAGIVGFSKALALELAPFEITVNTICVSDEDRRPEDDAGPVLFLASDAAAYVTGQTLTVSGNPLAGDDASIEQT